jgi:hypothetical protein
MTDRLKYFLLVSAVYGSLGAVLTVSTSMFSYQANAQSVTAPQSASASASAFCDKRQFITQSLTKDYKEDPVSMGVANTGAVIEIFASENGSWTMVLTKPDGMSCMIAAGSNWETLPKLTAGHKI